MLEELRPRTLTEAAPEVLAHGCRRQSLAAGDFPRWSVLEVPHLECLHPVVGIETQIMLDTLREVAPEHGVGVLEDRFERPDDDRSRR